MFKFWNPLSDYDGHMAEWYLMIFIVKVCPIVYHYVAEQVRMIYASQFMSIVIKNDMSYLLTLYY